MGVHIMHKLQIAAISLLLICSFVGLSINAIDVDIDQIKSQLPGELANSNITLDDAKSVLKEKCIKVAGNEAGGEAAYAEIEKGAGDLGTCITGIINMTAIQEEVEKARPHGELDVVFNKYCLKRPEALECVKNFTVKMESCLDTEEKENAGVFMRIITSLLNFVCHKGGDQIALFIAEKGPECLESNKDTIINCVNKTFSEYVPKSGGLDIASLPQFIVGPKQCGEMEVLETCIVDALEKCEEITPANIVESLFRFIKNETTCRSGTSASHQKSAANSVLFQVTANLGLLFAVFVLQRFI